MGEYLSKYQNKKLGYNLNWKISWNIDGKICWNFSKKCKKRRKICPIYW